jgi:integrase
LTKGTLRVAESLSKTKAGSTFEEPKTTSGRRTISLTASSIAELKAHLTAQRAQRMAMGKPRFPDDALVFPSPESPEWGPRDPDAISRGWARVLKELKVKQLSFHATRHSHASRLIAAGVDVVTVSKRLGHRDPAITLRVYSHLFGDTDAKAAKAIDNALKR